ncbi:MAG: hypothetical protein FJ152_01970 [Firmicutes bacterium]|nr:hypothetical protein [Bacillota bacterium]
MALTVQEALNLDIFSRCRVLTAGSGLKSIIHWVNILEILDDLSHIEPGEFLITTAHGMQALNTKRQTEMVEFFAERKMAAMAIQTGHYIEEIPASLISLFSAYNIPLIEIPPDISFKNITRSLMLSLLKAEKEDTGELPPAKGKDQLQRKYKTMLAIWSGLSEGKKPLYYHQDLLNLNIETERAYWICRLAACNPKRNRTLYPVQTEELLAEPVGQALFQLMEQRHISYLIGTAGDNLTLLLQPHPESGTGSTIMPYSRRVLEELRLRCVQADIYLGLSNCHLNLESWGKALEQAETALRAAVLGLVKQNGFGSYSALGPLKLILAVENTEALEDHLQETLSPLLEYDQRTGGALVQTLRTYLKYHNIKHASEELYVHRHTMKYRLNQIRKLTGINPEETSAVVILSEALTIYDYLKARGLHP